MQSQPSNYQPKHHSVRRLVSLLFIVAWVLVLVWAVTNRHNIHDWWRLRDYQAPSTIAALASADTMTSYGQKLFYINRPVIQPKSSFSSSCPNNGGEQTIVLGCYRDRQRGIFLLNVTDPRLKGVEQVTAAHEMLHAAYERLNDKDRQRVDSMLKSYYRTHLTDERVRSVINAYKKSEPKDVVNEMHSIFGTEIMDLPAELEEYYTKYFANRRQVVGFATKYQAEFTSRQNEITRYDQQLQVLKVRIDAGENDLKTRQAAINSQQANLLAQRSSNPAAYNAAVPSFNALVDAFNAEVEAVRSMVQQYNDLVVRRNAVALEEGQLIKSLSADTVPMSQ